MRARTSNAIHDLGRCPLTIEVADKNSKRDRTVKKRIYAEAGTPSYWIVNVNDRCVEVYTAPTVPATEQNPTADYRKIRTLRPDESIANILSARDVGRVAVRDLLP